MNLRLTCLFVLCLCLLLPATATTASELSDAALDHDAERLLAEGWEELGDDLYQRLRADGTIETLGYGAAGLERELGFIATQIELLRGELERRWTFDAHQSLAELEAHHEALREEIATLTHRRRVSGDRLVQRPVTTADHDETCMTSNTPYVEANAHAGSNGPSANAEASHSNPCNRYSNYYLYTRAYGDEGTQYHEQIEADGPATLYSAYLKGEWSSVTADSDCYSYAYARVRTPNNSGTILTYSQSDTNYACEPLEIGIVQGDLFFVPYGGCGSVTFTGTSNRSGTSFSAWKWDGSTVQSSGSTYTRTICSNNPLNGYTESHTLQLTGTQGGDTDTHSISVLVSFGGRPSGGGGDPCGPLRVGGHLDLVEPCP